MVVVHSGYMADFSHTAWYTDDLWGLEVDEPEGQGDSFGYIHPNHPLIHAWSHRSGTCLKQLER